MRPQQRTARSTGDLVAWLQGEPSTEEIRERFPAETRAVEHSIAEVLARKDFDELRRMAFAAARPPSSARRRPRSEAEQHALIMDQIRRHLAADALAQVRLALSTGVTEGKIRFNRINGHLLQRLLFIRDLERKPVSMFWFRVLWPRLAQRRLLMPLVTPQGIYCFYSRKLIRALAAVIGEEPCLEIAAGDGTLARFLAAEGVDITATDDHSWSDRVEIPESVWKQDARVALRVHQPRVVICSWPPADNPFERDVFRAPSVQLYIVLSTRHDYAAGSWAAYREQTSFDFAEAPELSRLLLPPELDPAVYVFRRKTTTPNLS